MGEKLSIGSVPERDLKLYLNKIRLGVWSIKAIRNKISDSDYSGVEKIVFNALTEFISNLSEVVSCLAIKVNLTSERTLFSCIYTI